MTVEPTQIKAPPVAQNTHALAQIKSRALSGIKAIEVDVQVHLSKGLPCMSIVGLPEKAVKESRDRVRSALITSGFDFPARKIIINLAPADIPKEGGRFDLAIAIGVLAAASQVPMDSLSSIEFLGELALDGHIRPIPGVLPAAIAAKQEGRIMIVPKENEQEVGVLKEAPVLVAKHLLDVVAYLSKQQTLNKPKKPAASPLSTQKDFSEVKGQAHAKRALELAAAGGHNLLMSGPPGTGKSMLASRLPSILPSLTEEAALEVATIQSVANIQSQSAFYQAPYRAPHHTASHAALIGGGSSPKPGEISLAHHGVLFLDELPEFSRHVLEVLREPLETGHVCISRAHAKVDFPAQVQLIAAMNPCPCGYQSSKTHECTCTPTQISRYRSKISGPLLDRIDCHIHIGELDQATLLNAPTGEASALIKKRVQTAQALQIKRQGCTNSQLSSAQVERYCALSPEKQVWLASAMTKLKLSARAYHRILKLARTIADCAGIDTIEIKHLAESLTLRGAR